MAIDQEAIKKRFSQIEDDINNMNKMIDDNLQIYDTTRSGRDAKHDAEADMETLKESSDSASHPGDEGNIVAVSPKEFSQVTASAASTFVNNSIKGDHDEDSETDRKTLAKTDSVEAVRTTQVTTQTIVEESTQPAPRNQLETTAQKKKPFESDVQTTVQESVQKISQYHEPVQETVKQAIHVSEETVPKPVDSSLTAGKVNADVTESEKAADHSANSSENFHDSSNSIENPPSLQSSPAQPEAQIFLPKNTQPGGAVKSPPSTPTTPNLRRPTNPFRVISIGSTSQDSESRKSSKSSVENEQYSVDSTSNTTRLEKRVDYLTKKCSKLQKEISYLHDMSNQATLPIEDKRKLAEAISKLQEYLDSKTKEKYEIGVQLSRQLRKEIDRGENGQFWVGTK